MIKRTKLIVYTDHLKSLHLPYGIGHLQYYSRKLHYAIFYVNADKAAKIQQQLKQNSRVKKVTISPLLPPLGHLFDLKQQPGVFKN